MHWILILTLIGNEPRIETISFFHKGNCHKAANAWLIAMDKAGQKVSAICVKT